MSRFPSTLNISFFYKGPIKTGARIRTKGKRAEVEWADGAKERWLIEIFSSHDKCARAQLDIKQESEEGLMVGLIFENDEFLRQFLTFLNLLSEFHSG